MTANQIKYQQLQEDKRANAAREAETHRTNVAQETERNRSNLATESLRGQELVESRRAAMAREAETNRTNLANEAIGRTTASAKTVEAEAKQKQANVAEQESASKIEQNLAQAALASANAAGKELENRATRQSQYYDIFKSITNLPATVLSNRLIPMTGTEGVDSNIASKVLNAIF